MADVPAIHGRALEWEATIDLAPPYDLALVEPDPALRADLAADLGDRDAAIFAEPGGLAERLVPGRRTVVVFGPSLADPVGLDEIDALTRTRPEFGAILVVPELSTGLFREALRSGARDVLAFPVEPGAITESVDRVGRSLVGTAPPPPLEHTEAGRIITVSSMKGGSGKTVVATNLAVTLARRSERPVVLVDADLQFGDVAVMLRLNAPHTIVDAIPAMDGLDAQFLRGLLVRHEPSGLLVLPAPLDPSLAERVGGPDMLRILEVLRSFCSYVVIDTPAQFNDVVLSVIEASDDIVVVAGMEIPNIKNTKLGLQTLQRLGVPESKLRLLVNRSNSKVQLDVKEVERTLGLKTQAHIPSDIVVPQAVNRGVAVVLDAPKAEVTRAFDSLADLFAPAAVAAPAKKARGLFGRG
ncbi:MAG TPA: AAA family ATPase [Acidimicrobiia bacterium]|nr:AAA family ATPase [Acidimicrobiia bacterium]